MTKDEIFLKVKGLIEGNCKLFHIPVPVIIHSYPDDPCDVTDVDHIRLNIDAFDGDDYEYYAAHVLGHYICDLHAYGGNDMADRMADAIAELLLWDNT
jgi:hypothetical protein